MATIGVRELKANASRVLKEVQESGEEIIITRRGKPCVKMIPISVGQEPERTLRSLRGALLSLPELDFDDFLDIKSIWTRGSGVD